MKLHWSLLFTSWVWRIPSIWSQWLDWLAHWDVLLHTGNLLSSILSRLGEYLTFEDRLLHRSHHLLSVEWPCCTCRSTDWLLSPSSRDQQVKRLGLFYSLISTWAVLWWTHSAWLESGYTNDIVLFRMGTFSRRWSISFPWACLLLENLYKLRLAPSRLMLLSWLPQSCSNVLSLLQYPSQHRLSLIWLLLDWHAD